MDFNVQSLIHPGDEIEIHYINMKNEDVFLDTMVYDVVSQDEILIHNPLKEGRLYMIPMGIKVNMFIKKPDLGVVIFEASLLVRRKIGSVYTISCQNLNGFQKQQRRNFFRVNLYKDMEVFYMRNERLEPVEHLILDPEDAKEEMVKIKATLLDVSGGGIGIKSSVPLPEGVYVYSTFNFLQVPINIHGVIVRSVESQKYLGEYELGIAFENLSREAVRKIASFVFSRQQEARRKERK